MKIDIKKITIFIILMLPVSAFSKELNIQVYDRDLEIPLEGVYVQDSENSVSEYSDYNGNIKLTIPDDANRSVLLLQLIGYENKKILITEFNEKIEIYLLMEGVLEGEELVVEAETIGETDEEVGVSVVVEQEQIEQIGKIGFIEDVMSVVKILPGVSYSGGMASNLSIRGSDSNGLVATLDGMVTNYPYHFEGMVSIFNPNAVENIKFSPGIFSVANGFATSALLEVNSIVPDDGLKYSFVLSSNTTEVFLQAPITSSLSLMAGFRLTYWEPAIRFAGLVGDLISFESLQLMTSMISLYPHLYDFYLKAIYEPSDKLKLYFNGFSGNDGMGITIPDTGEDKNETLVYHGDVNFKNNDLLLSTGVKFLPTDNLFIDLMVGYENWSNEREIIWGKEGTQVYTEEFKLLNGITEDSTYIEKTTDAEMTAIDRVQSLQSRVDIDLSLGRFITQFGIGNIYDSLDNVLKGFGPQIQSFEDGTFSMEKVDFDESSEVDSRVSTFAYANLKGDLIENFLFVETGIRADHFYRDDKNSDTENSILAYSPRLRLSMSVNDSEYILGAGLFANAPWNTDADIPEKSLMGLLGYDTKLPLDLHLRVEAYYKYVYDRTYNNIPDYDDMDLEDRIFTDGFGHIVGADLLFERKVSRFIDGMLSYTFVYARYQEPTIEDDYTYNINSEAPRGEYYWPSFHRFHSLNLLLNFKLNNNSTIMTKASFASGLPKRLNEQKEIIVNTDENIDEVTQNTNKYSDDFRDKFVLPVDIKYSYNNYVSYSKLQWEFYIAVENVFAPFLFELIKSSIEGQDALIQSFEDGGSTFDIPVSSIGFKLSF